VHVETSNSEPPLITDLPRLETRSFIAFLADNRPAGIHRAGYNGVASLIPRSTGNNIFVPLYAGLNYEVITMPGLGPYPGRDGFRFEPRCEPMHVEQDGACVTLVQPETSHAHVSARIAFRVQEPHYLHQHIELTPHRCFGPEAEPNRLSCLFASYIHVPPDRHIYVKPDPEGGDALDDWFGLTKPAHDSPRMEVRPLPDGRELTPAEHLEAMQSEPLSDDDLSRLPDEVCPPMALPRSLSGPLTFYYGLVHDLVFLMMFRQPERFRLAYSPCGGGREPQWSPAWDYVLHEEDAEPGRTYGWDLCLAVKPYAGRADVLEEVRRYMKGKCTAKA